jgi:hypothetical protein
MIHDSDSNDVDEYSSQLLSVPSSTCIARYKETIVTIANREQETGRTVAAQKEELQ